MQRIRSSPPVFLPVLYEIDKNEYARLRKLLLPAGSVIQEKENLTFLENIAKFYIGHGFLLCAHGENPTLYVYELLGDKSHAPDIIHTLGFSDGIIRTPGNSRPFTMYHSLSNNASTLPNYFGFAFD